MAGGRQQRAARQLETGSGFHVRRGVAAHAVGAADRNVVACARRAQRSRRSYRLTAPARPAAGERTLARAVARGAAFARDRRVVHRGKRRRVPGRVTGGAGCAGAAGRQRNVVARQIAATALERRGRRVTASAICGGQRAGGVGGVHFAQARRRVARAQIDLRQNTLEAQVRRIVLVAGVARYARHRRVARHRQYRRARNLEAARDEGRRVAVAADRGSGRYVIRGGSRRDNPVPGRVGSRVAAVAALARHRRVTGARQRRRGRDLEATHRDVGRVAGAAAAGSQRYVVGRSRSARRPGRHHDRDAIPRHGRGVAGLAAQRTDRRVSRSRQRRRGRELEATLRSRACAVAADTVRRPVRNVVGRARGPDRSGRLQRLSPGLALRGAVEILAGTVTAGAARREATVVHHRIGRQERSGRSLVAVDAARGSNRDVVRRLGDVRGEARGRGVALRAVAPGRVIGVERRDRVGRRAQGRRTKHQLRRQPVVRLVVRVVLVAVAAGRQAVQAGVDHRRSGKAAGHRGRLVAELASGAVDRDVRAVAAGRHQRRDSDERSQPVGVALVASARDAFVVHRAAAESTGRSSRRHRRRRSPVALLARKRDREVLRQRAGRWMVVLRSRRQRDRRGARVRVLDRENQRRDPRCVGSVAHGAAAADAGMIHHAGHELRRVMADVAGLGGRYVPAREGRERSCERNRGVALIAGRGGGQMLRALAGRIHVVVALRAGTRHHARMRKVRSLERVRRVAGIAGFRRRYVIGRHEHGRQRIALDVTAQA